MSHDVVPSDWTAKDIENDTRRRVFEIEKEIKDIAMRLDAQSTQTASNSKNLCDMNIEAMRALDNYFDADSKEA